MPDRTPKALALLDHLLDEGDEDDVARLVTCAHAVLLKHPIASRAAFRALVAEGRRFAETDAGRGWKERLEASDLVERARSVFEIASLGMLDEKPDVLPTQLIDMLAYAVSVEDLEPRLARAVEPRTDDMPILPGVDDER